MLKIKNEKQESLDSVDKKFPVVGIGASAGGLEAVGELFASMPVDTGISFVIIQHLDLHQSSMSSEILSRQTKLKVVEVKEDIDVQPDMIYVMPHDHDLIIVNGVLKLQERTEGIVHMPIDYFLHSLAEDRKRNAVGIVLSGTGSDGTLGLKSIKVEGGFTIAQEPSSAKYDGMPRSAIASGVVDLVKKPESIARELTRIYKQFDSLVRNDSRVIEDDENLTTIFTLLRAEVNIDFSHYKRTTIHRRVSRRLLVLDIDNLEAYASYLKKHPEEVKALFADILIHVTSFFREPKWFELLRNEILPQYFRERGTSAPFRLWVAGCSTGEEAYSIAITFLEFLEESGIKVRLNIFASDISEYALNKARCGFYSRSIESEVSPDRLERFFEKIEGGYKVSKKVRDLCIFSRHDLISDPPFAKLDMISCRNLLIYFSAPLQKYIFPIFHYALNPKGILWLGSAESIGEFSNIFSSDARAHKFYFKKNFKMPVKLQIPLRKYSNDSFQINRTPSIRSHGPLNAEAELDRIACTEYVPPGVLVNDDMDILYTRGQTELYLSLGSGQPHLNLFKMMSPVLVAELRAMIHESRKRNESVRRKNLSIKSKQAVHFFDINVVPVSSANSSKERYFSIFFEEATGAKKKMTFPLFKSRELKQKDQDLREMERKISDSHDYQVSLVEQFGAAQEELMTSNEELQSTNEELQSTNEELETAKEELQSTNEELIRLNEQLNTRNEQIKKAHDDAATILKKIPIPLIIIDTDMRVISANEPFYQKFRAKTSTTEGKLFSDLAGGDWNIPLLLGMIDVVLRKGTELQDYEVDHTFRDIGHKTMILNAKKVTLPGSGADAALVAIEDFTERKQTELKLKLAESRYRSLLTTALEGILIVNSNGIIDFVNNSVEDLFGYSSGELRGQALKLLISDKSILEYVRNFPKSNEGDTGSGLNLNGRRKDGSMLSVDISLSPVKTGQETFVSAIIRDSRVRESQEQETARILEVETNAREVSEQANRSKDEFVATLSHELRTPLASILSWSQLIGSGKLDEEKTLKGIKAIEQSAKTQSQIIDDLLDISRIQTNKLKLTIQKIDPSKVVSAAIDSTRNLAAIKSIQIETIIDESISKIEADPIRLQQILWNLITNAIKFSPHSGRVWIKIDRDHSQAHDRIRIQVRDNGKGIKKDFLPVIFDRFTQVDSSSTRSYGGLGLGLAIVLKLVRMHEGSIEVESPGEGKGATFTVLIPEKSSVTLPTPEAEEDVEIEDEVEIELEGLRVLLVDDEPNAREVFTVMIESFGAEVLTTSSAREAMAVIEDFAPDVLVSDIAMPDEDGYGLIEKIRALKSRFRNTPALALTAYAGQEDIQRSHLAGFHSHLAKPVDRRKLGLAIARLAGKK